MLEQLTIRNFALIEETQVQFGTGFSAITGETGAGKSVLMGALRVVVGGKTLPAMIRHEAKKILAAEEIDADDELIIQREILSGGKNRTRVNGVIIKQGTLQDLGETLIQMHGQSDQLLLRDLRIQLKLLDDYCACEPELAAYSETWSTWNKLKEELEKTEENARNLAEQKEFLTFQKNELEKAKLRAGEEAELEEKTSAASKSEAKMHAIEELSKLFDGENGLLSQFEVFQSKVRQFSSKLPEMENWAVKIGDAYDSPCANSAFKAQVPHR